MWDVFHLEACLQASPRRCALAAAKALLLALLVEVADSDGLPNHCALSLLVGVRFFLVGLFVTFLAIMKGSLLAIPVALGLCHVLNVRHLFGLGWPLLSWVLGGAITGYLLGQRMRTVATYVVIGLVVGLVNELEHPLTREGLHFALAATTPSALAVCTAG